jgi:hypothetical protein
MAKIEVITVRVKTGTQSGAGTDGDVYIGVAGREFYVDSEDQDFEVGGDRTYRFGAGPSVLHPDRNDPRKPQLSTQDVEQCPVYMRFEPLRKDAPWNVSMVSLTVNPGHGEIRYEGSWPDGGLWLEQKAGKFAFLERVKI